MRPAQPQPPPWRIGLSGPTGAGKTTFSLALGALGACLVIPEPLPFKLLAAFSEDPRLNCYQLQRAIISGRLHPYHSKNSNIFIQDRTVAEDLDVFVRLHAENGYLSPRQVARLRKLADAVESQAGLPHALVYMTASEATLRRRIAAEGAPEPVQRTLPRQLELYQAWVDRQRLPLCIINTDLVAARRLSDLAPWVLSSVQTGRFAEPAPDHPGVAWKRHG